MITEILVGEVKHAKLFSVLADEATDCSNVEQIGKSSYNFWVVYSKYRRNSLFFFRVKKVCLGKLWHRKFLILSKALDYVCKIVMVKGMMELKIWLENIPGLQLE